MQLTAAEVARALGLSVNTIHSDRQRGRLRGIRSGRRHWHYELDAVTEYVQRYSPTPSRSRPNPRSSQPGRPEPDEPPPNEDT